MLRLVLSPRWIAWHLLALGAMVACGFLAAWQWRRAESAMGSAVNVGYGLQWPVFAVFFAYIWWRMLRIEIAKLADASVPEQAQPAAQRGEPERDGEHHQHLGGGQAAVRRVEGGAHR